jgi:hypothetical protein
VQKQGRRKRAFDPAFYHLKIPDFVGEKRLVHFYLNLETIEAVLAVNDQLVMRFKHIKTEENLFDLTGKDIYSANNQHIVGAAKEAVYAPCSASACAGLFDKAGNIPRAVAQ